MVSDRVGDFIVRLQNAARVGKRTISTPYSSHLLAIAEKLKKLGFISAVEVAEGTGGVKKNVQVELFYDQKGSPKLRGVKRVSKPGRRIYISNDEAHTIKGGTGARLISASVGIVTDSEARKTKVGGEHLFDIW
jgi:small subunit ribosomal protein S8